MSGGWTSRTCTIGSAAFRHPQVRGTLPCPVIVVNNNVVAGSLCITPGPDLLPELRIVVSHRFTMITRWNVSIL